MDGPMETIDGVETGNTVAPNCTRPTVAEQQCVVALDVDVLAQEIRRVDGSNELGAGALAEAIMPFLRAYLSAVGGEAGELARLREENETYRTAFDGIEPARLKAQPGGDHQRIDDALFSAIGLIRAFSTDDVATVAVRELEYARSALAAPVSQEPVALCETGGARLLKNGKIGCLDCGEPYGSDRFPDLVIDNEAFAAIAPNPPNGGLLCPNCICARLAKAGLSNVPSRFTSGPLCCDTLPTTEGEPTALLAAKAGEDGRHG